MFTSREEQLSVVQTNLSSAPRKEKLKELEDALKESRDQEKKQVIELRKYIFGNFLFFDIKYSLVLN